jgi:CBS domain-containing protein
MIADSIGVLLIEDEPNGAICGIVTDRDIVRRIAAGVDPATETLVSFADGVVTTIDESATRAEVIRKFKEHGVRRLPVLDESGELIGIVSLDDVLIELGDELSNIAAAIRTEFRHEISGRVDGDA